MAKITKKEVIMSVQSFLYFDKKRPVLPLIYKTNKKKKKQELSVIVCWELYVLLAHVNKNKVLIK